MNERIKELVEQATSIVEVKHEGYQGRGYITQEEFFDREKFAELIVQECADLCLKHETMTGPVNTKVRDMGAWSDQAPVEYRKGHHFNTIIKNHFGVEL